MMAGPMPSYSLDLGSSAKSGDAQGGVASGSGWGSLNTGDWIIQRSGSGDNVAVPTGSKYMWLMAVAAAAGVWFLMRKK